MKKFALMAGLIFSLSGMLAFAQTSSTPTQQPDQTQMSGQQSSQSPSQAQDEVRKALQKDPALAQSSVTASTGSNNTVVLTGTVTSQAEKDRAETVARSASGGMTVDNRIQVGGSGNPDESGGIPPQMN